MNIYYGLRRTAWLSPDTAAIRTESGVQTYREFQQRVIQVGNMLRGCGVEPGDRVAVLMLNSPKYLELYYACGLIDAVIVPVNIRLGLDETAFWLNDSGTKVLVVDKRFASVPFDLGEKLQTVRMVLNTDTEHYEQYIAAASKEPEAVPEPADSDLAGIFYTSGTTGGPKGVMLSHRNLYANAMNILAQGDVIRQDGVWLHAAPMFHLADVGALFVTTLVGSSHAFLPFFDAESFLKTIERERVTHTILVPTMVNLAVNHPGNEKYDTSSLESIGYGASPMPLDLLRRATARFGPVFQQGYGMTEAAPLLTWLPKEFHKFEDAGGKWAPVKSAGQPIIGVEVRVVDNDDQPLPPYEIGEVIARGDNVMMGYWKREEITANTLRNGWLHTGDLGAFDERGFLYILDRAKDMIKTGGENVYSPEVETILYQHPAVLEAAVIGIPDEKWGEAIHAVVVLKPGQQATDEEIMASCREHLTHFKCPTTVEFIEALPKGGTGKIQKNRLRERFWLDQEKHVH